MKTYVIMALLSIILTISSIGFVAEVKLSMPVSPGIMVQYDNSVQAVAERTAR